MDNIILKIKFGPKIAEYCGMFVRGVSVCRSITWIIENVADLDLNRFE